ncbi:MAG: hypothetical protein GY796_04180 [Chloroflexi bacterium]|nr:hypothetical protein [Chloroflexota bacterium]
MSEETVYKVEENHKLARKHAWPAYLIIGSGILLLVANLFSFHLMDILWPGFIIVPGLMLLWPAYNSTPEHHSTVDFLAVPGALFVAVGALLFLMNLTNHFEAWAYSWPLLGAAVAAGIMYMYRFEPDHSVHESGRRFIRVMVFLFGGFAVFFEILIWGRFIPLFAVALIGYGVYMLAQNRREAKTL